MILFPFIWAQQFEAAGKMIAGGYVALTFDDLMVA
jgi:hypothetical protein